MLKGNKKYSEGTQFHNRIKANSIANIICLNIV